MVFHEAQYRYQGDGYLKARECSGGANDIHTPHSDLLSAPYPKIIMEKGQPVVLYAWRLVLPFHMGVLASQENALPQEEGVFVDAWMVWQGILCRKGYKKELSEIGRRTSDIWQLCEESSGTTRVQEGKNACHS